MQNESVDEDLEHFEDIVEETDNEPHMAAEAENDLESVQSGDKSNTASDSSKGEHDSPVPSSDDDDSDKAEPLGEDGSKEFEESPPLSTYNGNQPQISSTGCALPGGYNPRHREPSYWYVGVFSDILL